MLENDGMLLLFLMEGIINQVSVLSLSLAKLPSGGPDKIGCVPQAEERLRQMCFHVHQMALRTALSESLKGEKSTEGRERREDGVPWCCSLGCGWEKSAMEVWLHVAYLSLPSWHWAGSGCGGHRSSCCV